MAQPVEKALILGGIPQHNCSIYHRIRFLVGDPVAYLSCPTDGRTKTVLILRDIEMDRARRVVPVDEIACPADYAPAAGLSGDRETATAQAAAECLRRAGVRRVTGDRSLPLLYVEMILQAGIEVDCDFDLGVLERRRKDGQELAWIREAQQATEAAMEMACRMVARAHARADGVLHSDGTPLTAERVRAAIDHFLLDRGYANPPAIVAGGPVGADCHDYGAGELRTGEPVIIDIFPRNRTTLYNGDCTRTVVHGDIPDEVRRMHAAVSAAKVAAIAAARSGITGEAIHRATVTALAEHGYYESRPGVEPLKKSPVQPGSPDSSAIGAARPQEARGQDSTSRAFGTPIDKLSGLPVGAMRAALTHGTGHGVGLEVHEPPLLDYKGPELLDGDVVTIEPGLYCPNLGGVRLEDMVVLRPDGCENLNRLPEELSWR
jgi:Xaa-Pro aminopeptidase